MDQDSSSYPSDGADEHEKAVAGSPILRLPPELLIQICSPLNARDLAAVCLSCSHLREFINNCEPVWKNLLKRMLFMDQKEQAPGSYFCIFEEGGPDEQLVLQANRLLSVLPPDAARFSASFPSSHED